MHRFGRHRITKDGQRSSKGGALWGAALAAMAIAARALGAPQVSTQSVRLPELGSGVPIGSIGCGTFQLRPDGMLINATINNNWLHPTGGLNGCFAAVWTNAGGRIVVRSLRRTEPYGLPTVANLEYRGLFPQAFLRYPDRELPVTLSLRVFSPLIPHDLKNSALPVALFVFRVTNVSRAPVEASLALSWENFLGVGWAGGSSGSSDRTGNLVAPLTLPAGFFGCLMTSPPAPTVPPADRLRYNALGEYALMTHVSAPDAHVTQATWNSLASQPAWWHQFAADGTVGGSCGTGVEGSVHPAGVVAVKLPLRDRETREVAFAVSWFTRRLWTVTGEEYGHYYEMSFQGAAQVARYALENRLALAALTDDWQQRLLRSNLPKWLAERLINDAAPLATNTILTRGEKVPRYTVLPTLSAPGRLGATTDRPLYQWLLACWFPELDAWELGGIASLQTPAGNLPESVGDLADGFLRRPAAGASGPSAPDTADAFALMVWRHAQATADQRFMDALYPVAKHAMQANLRTDRVPAEVRPAILTLAALRAMEQMANRMDDGAFARECQTRAEALAKDILDTFWNGRGFGAKASKSADTGQLAGQALADAEDLGDLLPRQRLDTALDTLLSALHQSKLPAPPLFVALDKAPTPGLSCPTMTLAYLAVPAANRNRPTDALQLLQQWDTLLTTTAGMPWGAPKTFDPATGRPAQGPSYFGAAASWNVFQALEGLTMDLPAGRIVLTPHLPAGMSSLSAPVFAPAFVGWMEYAPGQRTTRILLRVDQVTQSAPHPLGIQGGADLRITEFVVPWPDVPAPTVTASLGREPAGFSVSRGREGRMVIRFTSEVHLTAGTRLEVTIR
ncbi:MAG: GH116 family glycosyl-hydrolase [Chthonomonadales bacterium]